MWPFSNVCYGDELSSGMTLYLDIFNQVWHQTGKPENSGKSRNWKYVK